MVQALGRWRVAGAIYWVAGKLLSRSDGLSFSPQDQIRCSDAQRLGQHCDRCERGLALCSLDPADVVAVDPGIEAQLLLGEVLFGSEVAYCLAEANE